MRSNDAIRMKNGSKETSLLLATFVLIFSVIFTVNGWSQEFATVDDLLAQVSAIVPAFGGVYVDQDTDTVYVYMVPGQAGDLAALDKAFTAVLGSNRPPGSHLVAVPGRYTFLQLKAWQNASDAQLLTLPGVASTGIHHSTNRLQVGVATPEVGLDVLSRLAALGVPSDAVEVVQEIGEDQEVAGFLDTDSIGVDQLAGCTSVQSKCRPVIGGLQIAWTEEEGDFVATLSFNATRNGVPGFVTCSHCAQGRFQNQGTVYFQNDVGDAQIGTEALNPGLTNLAGTAFTCPSGGTNCRLSESLFASYDEGVDVQVGYIARPGPNINGGDCNLDPGLCAWNGNASFRITAYRISYEGENIGKVGRRTGLTLGKVTGTCRNVVSGTAELVCQVAANYASMKGDSGSPVFGCPTDQGDIRLKKPCSFVGPDLNPLNVHLLGVHWRGGTARYYSNVVLINNAVTELGPLTKFCAADVFNPSCN